MSETKMDLELLKKLCNAFGPSGHENEAQKIARDYGAKFADKVLYDRLGSVVLQRGTRVPR